MAADRGAPPAGSHGYRTQYLKLRSVLFDRPTGFPAFPLLIDELRELLEAGRAVAVIHIDIENGPQVESLYGWQVFDRLREAFAGTLRGTRGVELPDDSLLALTAVAASSFLIFVPAGPQDGGFEDTRIRDWCAAVRSALQEVLAQDRFAGLGPRLEVRTGHALLSLDPFYRFERRLHAAVEESARYDADRRSRRERSWNEELQRILQARAVHSLFPAGGRAGDG